MKRLRALGGVRESLTFHEALDDLRVAWCALWRAVLSALGIR